MEKTFTDCYFADGFTGGGWGYAMNTTDAEGSDTSKDFKERLPESEQKLAYYCIGWDSLAVREDPAVLRFFKITDFH
jgi:hypothetical protein